MSSHLLEKITERLDPSVLKQQQHKSASNTTPASSSSAKQSTKPPTKIPIVDLNNNSININESNTTPITQNKVNLTTTNSNQKQQHKINNTNIPHKSTLDHSTVSPIVINAPKKQ